MPLDLNQYDLEKLTEAVARLRPGQALVSNDGIVIRRRHNSSGYDCGVGQGGTTPHKLNTPAEAADRVLSMSANYSHPAALGGVEKFDDFDVAIERVRRGEATPAGPSPALKAIRGVMRGAGVVSYRNRAQRARQLLADGKVWEAVRQLEAVVEHAGGRGNLKDVERAEAALAAIREHHDYEPGIPTLTRTSLEVKARGGEHFVYRDGEPVTPGMTRGEAEARRSFLARKIAREEDIDNIEREIAGKPVLIERADEAA